jgi:hypothetical protein
MKDISPENLDALDSRYRTTAIVILAQIAFTIVLTVAVCLFAPASGNSITQQTLTTLWVVIIFLAIGAFVLRRMFFRWDRLKDITLLKGISGLLGTLQSNAVLLGIMATLLAIVGSVITILNGETFEAIRAAIVALIVFAINFPRKSVWEKIVAGMEKV